jgi:hypothetical protein
MFLKIYTSSFILELILDLNYRLIKPKEYFHTYMGR